MCCDAPKCHGGKFIGGAKKGVVYWATLLACYMLNSYVWQGVGNIFWTDVVYSIVWCGVVGGKGGSEALCWGFQSCEGVTAESFHSLTCAEPSLVKWNSIRNGGLA